MSVTHSASHELMRAPYSIVKSSQFAIIHSSVHRHPDAQPHPLSLPEEHAPARPLHAQPQGRDAAGHLHRTEDGRQLRGAHQAGVQEGQFVSGQITEYFWCQSQRFVDIDLVVPLLAHFYLGIGQVRRSGTLSAIRLFPRFCKMFSESSTVVMQVPCCPGKPGELSENCLPNLQNDLMAGSV